VEKATPTRIHWASRSFLLTLGALPFRDALRSDAAGANDDLVEDVTTHVAIDGMPRPGLARPCFVGAAPVAACVP
jgi:hypothetical protein